MNTTLSLLLVPALGASSAYMIANTREALGTPPPRSVKLQISRGEQLVRLNGCADCHTPEIMTESGPRDDPARKLSGHPAATVPQFPTGENPASATSGMTAWSGPWGVSYASNLTPDHATGLGDWTQAEFIRAMKNGRHRGDGRAILPPMPWRALAQVPDEDLAAIFAYLRSVPAVSNRVPEPKDLEPQVAKTR